jgi:phosphinothricin acetyltransferase
MLAFLSMTDTGKEFLVSVFAGREIQMEKSAEACYDETEFVTGEMEAMKIRKAEQRDLQELLDIYNYEVLNGVATLDLEPKSLEEWQVWFDEHNRDNHPLYVAEQDGRVAGYVSLSSYRAKEAYRSTVELSIYIRPDCRRQGIATSLMAFIIEKAWADASIHNVVSVITSGNEASSRLHDKFGFEFCGTIREVGVKFGKNLSIDNFSLLV